MKNEKWTRTKKSIFELYRHAVVMKNGWRVGLWLANAVLLLMLTGCTPLW
jgi:hypothetical protein